MNEQLINNPYLEHSLMFYKFELEKTDKPSGKIDLLAFQKRKEELKQKVKKLREKFLIYKFFKNVQELDDYLNKTNNKLIHAYPNKETYVAVFYKQLDFPAAMLLYWSAEVLESEKDNAIDIFIPPSLLGKFIGSKGFNINRIAKNHKLFISAHKLEQEEE